MWTWRAVQIKIHISFYGSTSLTLKLRKIKFCIVNIIDVRTSFVWIIIILFDEDLKCGNSAKFSVYVGTTAKPACLDC
jgi:hypothetical protein